MMMPLLLFVDSQCVFMWIYGFLKAFELVNFMDLFIVSVNFGVLRLVCVYKAWQG